jgi:adhesin transport system membrane fusion protein
MSAPSPKKNNDTENFIQELEKKLGNIPFFMPFFFYGLVGFISALVLWSWFAPLDVVVQTTGEVVPLGKIQTIQHLEGGIINQILVKEGDFVNAQQPLVTLRPTNQKASLDELDNRISSLIVNKWRLENELSEQTNMNTPPQSLPLKNTVDLFRNARLLFRERQKNLNDSIALQDNNITQRSQEMTEEAIRIKQLEERRTLLAEQININEQLISDDLSNRYEHIELLKQLNSINSAIESGEATLLRLKTAVNQAKREKEHALSEFRASTRSALQKTEQELNELSERRIRLSDSFERTTLTAPLSGIVKTLYTTTKGGVISPGAPVLDIVPQEDGIYIRARLAPQDIGHVKLGQSATLRLTSADAPLFGNITGNVTFISPDTIVPKNNRPPHYIVHLSTESTAFNSNNNVYPLFPGMLLSIGITTGKRTVAQYLLSPFSQSLSFALTER